LIERAKDTFGVDAADIAEHCMKMSMFEIKLGEEAIGLIDRYFQ